MSRLHELWLRIERIHSARAVPYAQKMGTPPAGMGVVWISRATGEVNVTKPDGTTTSLEGGSGGGTPASTVVTETSYGQASAVGTGTDYARNDHTHGTPAAELTETAGPTTLTMGAVSDGQVLKRSGSTIIGVYLALALVTVGDGGERATEAVSDMTSFGTVAAGAPV